METHREKIIRRAGLIVSFNYGLLAAKKNSTKDWNLPSKEEFKKKKKMKNCFACFRVERGEEVVCFSKVIIGIRKIHNRVFFR
jgi:hypothetical protein